MKPLPLALAAACAAALLASPAHAAKKPAKAWDLDGDGRQDIVYSPTKTKRTDIIKIRYSGTGKTQSVHGDSPGIRRLPSRTWSAVYYTSADFDRDGYADLATLGAYGIGIVYGSKKGLTKRISYRVHRTPGRESDNRLRVADFDGDGYPDLLATTSSKAYVHLAVGKGGQRKAVDVGPAPVRPGDFDADGHDDLYRDGSVLPGGVGAPVPAPLPTLVSDFAAGDGNGDGTSDLLAVRELEPASSRLVFEFHQSPLGGRSVPVLRTGGDPARVVLAAGDLNRDGSTDFLFSTPDRSAKRVYIAYGSADGPGISRILTPPAAHREGLSYFGGTIRILDVDKDGWPEVLLGNEPETAIKNTRFFVYKNRKGRILSTGVKTYKLEH